VFQLSRWVLLVTLQLLCMMQLISGTSRLLAVADVLQQDHVSPCLSSPL
jgi:hypothetical protein